MSKEEKYNYIRTHVFRNEVPEELKDRFWKSLGLKGQYDCHWWPETLLDIPSIKNSVLECITELEPYYQRCYSYYATREMSKNSILQVLRHVAKLSSREIETSDNSRTSHGQKRIRMFRLSLKDPESSEESIFSVDFS